eukprot:gene14162-23573_t
MLLCIFAAAACATPHLWETMPSHPSDFPWPFADMDEPQFHLHPLGPPPPPPPVLAFAKSFGNHMVLQQSPAIAAVYGSLPNITSPSTDPVMVHVSGGSNDYTVTAIKSGAEWKAMLKPTTAGGSYKITVTMGTNFTANITDATFGDVWYCGGQSNMALPVMHTLSQNISIDAIKAGKYNNIRLKGIAGNMNPDMDWTTALDATKIVPPGKKDPNPTTTFLQTFSSTCWYFGESLVDELGEGSGATTPIGLIHTAFGGSEIEQWLDNATIAECGNASISAGNAEWHTTRVLPFVNMTLKGENDMHNYFGSSLRKTGYACLMPKLVSSWRALWSQTPGTTDPNAPFGVVTLASSGSEGGADIRQMGIAQTAGVIMPETFVAQAFDLADLYGNISCYKSGCCTSNNPNATMQRCHGCSAKFGGPGNDMAFCDVKAGFYMGPIHPRSKKPVGCTKEGSKLTLLFNKTLLGDGGGVMIQDRSDWGYSSMVDVLVNKSAWCVQTKSNGKKMPLSCWDDGFDHVLGPGPAYDAEYTPPPAPNPNSKHPKPVHNATFAWMPVNIEHGADGSSILVDLTASAGGGDCCAGRPPSSDPCFPGSCPLLLSLSGKAATFPANPFEAQITAAGKCACIPPAVCDE